MKTTKNFIAVIYQTNKKGNTTFNYEVTGTIEKKDNVKTFAEFMAKRVFRIVKAQNNIQSKGGKQRFFDLAKSKKTHFFFSVNGSELLNTELKESINIRLDSISDENLLSIILTEIMNIFSDMNVTL